MNTICAKIEPFEASISELIALLDRSRACGPKIVVAGERLANALKAGGKIMTAGNGGSAAEALHMTEELIGRFSRNRKSLAAICLAGDPTALTCIANDYGCDEVFARQVEGLGLPGDVLVVFTSSGNSQNLIVALSRAKERGVQTIALLGKDGGKTRGLSDLEIIIPSQNTARIQEVHQFIMHNWLAQIESALFDGV